MLTLFPLIQSSEKAAKSDVADDYDRAVRELVFEKRGQPTDRMKSQEELAREERERLEKLEVNQLQSCVLCQSIQVLGLSDNLLVKASF